MDEENKKSAITVDSNCLTYLITVMNDVLQPCGNLAAEKTALFRILIYSPPIYYTNTVKEEYGKISNEERREMHENESVLSYHPIIFGVSKIPNIADEYNKYHKGERRYRDCKILAEAELMNADVLLTYDDDFHRNLRSRSHHVKLLKPCECWDMLAIRHGAKPKWRPIRNTNPMCNVTWWEW